MIINKLLYICWNNMVIDKNNTEKLLLTKYIKGY